VQQVVANPGVLERFGFEGESLLALRSTFAGLYSLSDDDYTSIKMERGSTSSSPYAKLEDIIANARSFPDNYVMKPQREVRTTTLLNFVLFYVQVHIHNDIWF